VRQRTAAGRGLARGWRLPVFAGAMVLAWLQAADGQPATGANPLPTPDTASARGDGGKIRVIINPSGSQSFPAVLVQKLALDKKHGFVVEIMPSPSTQAEVIAIQSRNAEIGIWNWPDVARMHQAETKVIGIAPSEKWVNTFIVPADSPASTLADLRGKRIGVLRRTGLDWVVMRALSKKRYGFDIDAEANVQEATVALLRGLMDQGQLDGTIMYGDFTPAMVAGGKYRLFSAIRDYVAELGIPDAPYSLVAARMDYAAEHAQNVKAFLVAYREAVDILLRDDTAWFDPAKQLLKMTDPHLVAMLREQTRPLFVPKFTPETVAAIRRTFDVLLETAGPGPLGISRLPDEFLTTAYQ
jgi:NitT/TauT family transport system substrate-binding protein